MMLLSLIFLVGTISHAADFPNLCPNAKNLSKICAELRRIDSDKTLIFTDGSEMPACLLLTSSIKSETSVYESQKVDLSPEFEVILKNTVTLAEKQNALFGMGSDKTRLVNSLKKQKLSKTVFEAGSNVCGQNAKMFNSVKDKIEFGGGAENYPRMARLALLGHEISHSMQYCVKEGMAAPEHPIFSKLVSCLKNDVGNFSSKPDSAGCDSHKNEAFCDHIGVHLVEKELKKGPLPVIVGRKLQRADNVVRMPVGYDIIIPYLDRACYEISHSDESKKFNLSPKRRLMDIFLKNPHIAKALNCPVDTEQPYCDVEKGTVNLPKGNSILNKIFGNSNSR